MADWLTVRVVLLGRDDDPPGPEPGRILLVRADHTFADLADAVDTAFARWDLTPPHAFDVAGRQLWSDVTVADGPIRPESSGAVQVGEVGLRVGSTFRYLFDLGERWEHFCEVERIDVDPLAEYGDQPELPVPVFGWGTIADQYGRDREDDDDPSADAEPFADDAVLQGDGWDTADEAAYRQAELAARADAWQVVATMVDAEPPPPAEVELQRAARTLRHHLGDDRSPYDLLWAAVDLDVLPEDDALLWTTAAAAVVEPRGALPVEPDVEAAWTALEPADWAGAVIELVRAGVGTPATPSDLVTLVAGCPEIDGPPLTVEDVETLELAFTPVVRLWRALGAVDDRYRLSPLGRWGLPESLRAAWT